jgi:hypothetical protein
LTEEQSQIDFTAMKRIATWFFSLLAGLLQVLAQSNAPPTVVRYTLLDGSHFIDNCAICGRPTILQPLRGTFDLVLVQDTPPVTRYEVRNIDFIASQGAWNETRITGSGTYQRFEEFANVQDMKLSVQVKTSLTNRLAFFTNGTSVATEPWPRIKVSLVETGGAPSQTFSMDLFATPMREVWFSITRSLTNATGVVSPGDLLSNRGRVVRRNIDLMKNFGVMPSAPDVGLDAVDVTRGGEILFSIPIDVFSGSVGMIHNGDLLSDRGRIVKRNQELLAAFGVTPGSADAGLDGVQLMPNGEILFSTRSNVVVSGVVSGAVTLSNGDILSDQGRVFQTQKQLLALFHPTVTNQDFGLDAMRVFPDGEIWFSVVQGFTDTQLGPILPGDVLSNRGYRAFRNSDLVAAFQPADPSIDYGLDALFVVTDVASPLPPPRLTGISRVGSAMRVSWDGDGSVFELERASDPSGPWDACSPLLPDLFFDDNCAATNGQYFYRLRQW